KPERVPVRINQILEDTLALRDYDLRMKNIRVHLDLAPDLPVTSADPHQLQQVFLNLVNNAVDAILDSATEGDLWVGTSLHGDRLTVEFADSGPGVREPSRVFDPFYTTKPVGKGTGLGLSICYGIITEHGGTIHVRNIPSQGASFTIELPFQAATEPRSADGDSSAPPVREGRILLVDQDASVLEAVGAILRGRSHVLRSADTTAQAKSELARQAFDFVIADLHTSIRPDGDDLAKWLECNQPALLPRLVWMRASTPGETSPLEPKSGLQVLQKPFKAGDLL